jgi:hypothetical protein
MSDAEIIDIAATSDLTYLGFKPTAGVCARCGSVPRGGSLYRFAVIGPTGRALEIEPTCLFGRPRTGDNWRVVLTMTALGVRPVRRARGPAREAASGKIPRRRITGP